MMYDFLSEFQYEILQPWSTFVMKTQLPPDVFQKMTKITDEIVERGEPDASLQVGAGEMKKQLSIDFKILEQVGLMEYFLQACKQYIIQAFLQAHPENKENILKKEWLTQMTLMWINSTVDNEYFPLHSHMKGQLSSVMYLKIPEYLPATSPYTKPGAIEFINNTSRNHFWGCPSLLIQPQVGEFYIFTIDQQHIVYPFQTQGGNGERRSVSFNAEFKNK